MSILESPLIDWTIFSSTIQLIVKGLLIGIIVSAPMGPVGVLCIQRTMHRGRNVGLVTGLGASLSDLIYAIITGAGMTLVMSFVEQEQNIYWMKIGGSAILFGFGLHTLLSNPLKAIRRSKHKRGSLVHNFITSFFLTLSNPLIIFLFIALFYGAAKSLRCILGLYVHLRRGNVVVGRTDLPHHTHEELIWLSRNDCAQSHHRCHRAHGECYLCFPYPLSHPS